MAGEAANELSAEERALRCSAARDREGFSRAIREIQTPVFRLTWRITGDAALAEEAAARVFVKLWEAGGSWRGEASARTWVYRVAVRAALDARKSRLRWWRRWIGNPTQLERAGSIPEPHEAASRREEREALAARVQAALAQLTPEDRALIHLYYFEDRSLPEIAEILEVRRETLKVRLARARAKLKPLLEAEHALE